MKALLLFFQQLCAIPEIANSEEMQEFLALNTDARIAFVKKPFVVSRIDKVTCVCLVSCFIKPKKTHKKITFRPW